MTRTYYTLCLWDTLEQAWFDQFGDYCKADVQLEAECYDNMPKRFKVIIRHRDTVTALIAARDALPVPARPRG